MAYDALPDDGVMLLHTITGLTLDEAKERGIPLTMDAARFVMFIVTEIFPGGQLPTIETVEQHATDGRLHGHPHPVAAAALRADAGHLGAGAGVRTGTRPSPSSPRRSTTAT